MSKSAKLSGIAEGSAGAARRRRGKTLPGMRLPHLTLAATDGSKVDLSQLKGRTVVYAYPRTGVPGQPLRGAGTRSRARAAARRNRAVFAIISPNYAKPASIISSASRRRIRDYQSELAKRLHLPFAILSDAGFEFTKALRLPTFEVEGMTLLKRLTLVIDDSKITHVFYPVFPPDKSAQEVVDWLQAARSK